MTMDTACSSSLLALDRATRDIKAGVITRAIVAGVSLCLDHCKNAILIIGYSEPSSLGRHQI